MKVIIAGSRSITGVHLVGEAIHASPFADKLTEVVSGGAAGVDHLGELWARAMNVPIKRFPAKWTKYGRSAGMVRNQQMAWYADALIAVWDGVSPGTAYMIDFMHRLKKPVYVYTSYDGDTPAVALAA